MRLTTALIGLLLLSIGCAGGSASVASDSAQPAGAKAATASPSASDALPSPKTHVMFQSKYTHAIPMKGGKSAYTTVNQWVFVPDGKDESLICISDSDHCITLVKLQEQLNRPASDVR